MNPRPIIVASIIAMLFVVAAYFGGRFTFEGCVEDTWTSTHFYNPYTSKEPEDENN